jgi:hypothetical protein
MTYPAIALLEVKTSKIARQVIHGTGVKMLDWSIGVVASRHRVPGTLVVVVVAALKLGVEPVPAV